MMAAFVEISSAQTKIFQVQAHKNVGSSVPNKWHKNKCMHLPASSVTFLFKHFLFWKEYFKGTFLIDAILGSGRIYKQLNGAIKVVPF